MMSETTTSAFSHNVDCPGCDSKGRAAVYDDGHTHCHKCGYHTNTVGEKAPDTAHSPARALPQGASIQSLPSRHLTADTCRKYGYMVTERGNHVAPYHDANGRQVAVKFRVLDPKDFRWQGTPPDTLFGQRLFKGDGKHLAITEGEIDCLSVSQSQENKYPVVSLRNGASGAVKDIQAQLEWVESFEDVVLMFDMDEPGQEAAKAVCALLSPGKARIAQLSQKDPNEVLVLDGAPKLVTAFWEAIRFRPDGMLTGAALWEQVRNEPPPAMIPYTHPGLQDLTGGMVRGQITTLAGGTASGKTTLSKELVSDLLRAGEKVAIISLEETPRDTLLGLLTTRVDQPLLLALELNLSEHRAAWAEVEDQVILYEHAGRRMDASALADTMRYLTKGEGCTVVVVDNLSVVVSSSRGQSQGERVEIDQFMQTLVAQTQESGAAVLLLVHLKRPSEGDGYEKGKRVSLTDLRGSSLIESFSNAVISLERDQEAGGPRACLATARVLKSRRTGKAGVAGQYLYNRETGRLLPQLEELEGMGDL